jgi:transposase
MARREELTDEQCSLIEPLFDKPPVITTRGRPRRAEREVMNGVLWILRSGARWCDLPDRFPQSKTGESEIREITNFLESDDFLELKEKIVQDKSYIDAFRDTEIDFRLNNKK